jgi:FMN reductase
MTLVRTVIVSGSSSSPSKTLLLAETIASALAKQIELELDVVDIAEVGSDLGRALSRADLSKAAEQALRTVENAQILIAATPVYRGSYSGHFKHLFDLIGLEALLDVPVILAATGGGEKHCLVIEHQLRPLFAFLQAFAVPVGVYATHIDFLDGVLTSELVRGRIEAAVRQAVQLVRPLRSSAASSSAARPALNAPRDAARFLASQGHGQT